MSATSGHVDTTVPVETLKALSFLTVVSMVVRSSVVGGELFVAGTFTSTSSQ